MGSGCHYDVFRIAEYASREGQVFSDGSVREWVAPSNSTRSSRSVAPLRSQIHQPCAKWPMGILPVPVHQAIANPGLLSDGALLVAQVVAGPVRAGEKVCVCGWTEPTERYLCRSRRRYHRRICSPRVLLAQGARTRRQPFDGKPQALLRAVRARWQPGSLGHETTSNCISKMTDQLLSLGTAFLGRYLKSVPMRWHI